MHYQRSAKGIQKVFMKQNHQITPVIVHVARYQIAGWQYKVDN